MQYIINNAVDSNIEPKIFDEAELICYAALIAVEKGDTIEIGNVADAVKYITTYCTNLKLGILINNPVQLLEFSALVRNADYSRVKDAEGFTVPEIGLKSKEFPINYVKDDLEGYMKVLYRQLTALMPDKLVQVNCRYYDSISDTYPHLAQYDNEGFKLF